MAKRCLTRKVAVTRARAQARRTGDKVSIWQCAPRCFKVGAEPSTRGRSCRWRGWAIPRLR